MTSTRWRARVHRSAPVALAWRAAVFLVGLLCVAGGLVLAVLPGPLTIPPVLLGLWIWSTEFTWAQGPFALLRRRAAGARQHAREHPVASVAVTVGGLALVVAAAVVVGEYDLVERARAAVGS